MLRFPLFRPNVREVVGLFLVAWLTAGCLGSPEMVQVQREFQRAHPDAQFERDLGISAGPLTLSAVWNITRLEQVDRLRPFLTAIEGVKVGAYSITGPLSAQREAMPLLGRMRERGWAVAARTHDDADQTWLLYNTRYDRVREFYFLRLDSDRLLIVRLRGDLERMIGAALAERDWQVTLRDLSVVP